MQGHKASGGMILIQIFMKPRQFVSDIREDKRHEHDSTANLKSKAVPLHAMEALAWRGVI
jgi:hypothetical protein